MYKRQQKALAGWPDSRKKVLNICRICLNPKGNIFDVNIVFLYTFGLGAYLAGLAGALSAPIMGLTPSMGLDILPICFVVVVVAGLGSIPGAIIAGILIGLSQGAATIWFPEATNVVIYVMMGLTIIFRPQGLFGVR